MQIRTARLDERLLMPAPCGRETGVIRQLCALAFATCGESLDRNIIQSDPQAMRAPPSSLYTGTSRYLLSESHRFFVFGRARFSTIKGAEKRCEMCNPHVFIV